MTAMQDLNDKVDKISKDQLRSITKMKDYELRTIGCNN